MYGTALPAREPHGPSRRYQEADLHESVVLRTPVPLELRMKPLLVLWAAAALAWAGNVFVTEYEYRADLNVFPVEYEHRADLNVLVVDYEYRADDKDGLWYYCDYEHQADVLVYFCEYEHQADLKVFFVDYEHQAGWNDSHPWQHRLH